MERGDVVWFDPDPVRGSEQSGRRPALVITRNAINRTSRVMMVIPFTTFRGGRLYPNDVVVKAPEGGLSVDSVALTLQMRSSAVERLGPVIGRLSSETLARVENAILNVLEIDR